MEKAKNLRMNKRAQASVEFFSTYGWVFFIILLMIAAVSYFGVMKPEVFVPQRCLFASDITCDDFIITSTQVDDKQVGVLLLTLRQTLGRSVYIENLQCKDEVFGSDSLGYYHEPGSSFSDTTYILSKISETNKVRQWDPGEKITLKCHFSKAGVNPFEGHIGETAHIPVTVTVKKRDDGFDHKIDGEIIGKIQ